MEQTFGDVIGSTFDNAETIDFRQGETPEGPYIHARVKGVDEDSLDEKLDTLSDEGIMTSVNECVFGLEVEAWT